MPEVKFGRKDEPSTVLQQTDEFIAVRTRQPVVRRGAALSGPLEAALPDSRLVAAFPEANVGVYRLPNPSAEGLQAEKAALNAMDDVRFAGRVLVDPAGKPVVYTENLFVKFKDDVDEAEARAVLEGAGLEVKRRVDYAPNAYFASADGRGQEVFDIAQKLLERPDVEYSHPEVVRERARKGVYAQQWHLHATTVSGVSVDAHANVAAAHALSTGAGVVIAVIDDGVDVGHPEFVAPGKVVSPRDATLKTNDPRPKDPNPFAADNHGTACAGVACASGIDGASGVAPDASLMPIRLSSALGSQAEAEAFYWAASNGADVISCSWGPPDGDWSDPDDPTHTTPWDIPASTRLAIDNAVQHGRGGRGCIVLFAAGNGNEDVGYDGYASYKDVIAVAACNDRSVRSVYSDYGPAVWCAFPSNDIEFPKEGRPAPLTSGIWTTDRRGRAGYNSGDVFSGDQDGDYANDFGGTSSACPGMAGVAALMLAANPSLDYKQVRELLRQACDRIDTAAGDYDQNGWSRFYGWGRVNALTAVQLAQSAAATASV